MTAGNGNGEAPSGAGAPALLLRTPALASLWAYWARKLQGRGILPRSGFLPYEVPHLLGILTLVERTPAHRYRFRLVGTEVVRAYGFDPTGKWFDEVLARPRFDIAVAHAKAAFDSARPVFSKTQYVSPGGADWSASRLIIPLADAAGRVSTLLVGNVLGSRIELARQFGDEELLPHDDLLEVL